MGRRWPVCFAGSRDPRVGKVRRYIAGCSRVLLGLKPSSIWQPHWTISWRRFGIGVCRTALNSRRWSVNTATTPCWMIWVCRLSLGDRWGADNKPRELVLITSLATRGRYAEHKWREKLTIIRNTKCLPVFLFSQAEKRGLKLIALESPPLLPPPPPSASPPPTSNGVKHTHAKCFSSQQSKSYNVCRRTQGERMLSPWKGREIEATH